MATDWVVGVRTSARHTLSVLAVTIIAIGVVTVPAPHAQILSSGVSKSPLPASADRAYGVLAPLVDGDAAMEIVRFMDQYWRIAGNPGFNASVDHIKSQLEKAGVASRVDEFAGRGRGWDYQVGTVSFADSGEVLLSRDRDRVSLCINSFSTPAGGIDAPLVDVGNGAAAADYEEIAASSWIRGSV